MGSIRPFLDIQIFYSTLYIWHSYLPMWGKKKNELDKSAV